MRGRRMRNRKYGHDLVAAFVLGHEQNSASTVLTSLFLATLVFGLP